MKVWFATSKNGTCYLVQKKCNVQGSFSIFKKLENIRQIERHSLVPSLPSKMEFKQRLISKFSGLHQYGLNYF